MMTLDLNVNKEVWKDIEGYEGLYQVSNLGNVKSLSKPHHRYESIVSKQINKNGYVSVTLSKKHKTKKYYVHRLVATNFVKNDDGFEIVNHIDENPKNNRFDNLEWCDQKYNVNYGTLLSRRSLSRQSKVLCVDNEGNTTMYNCVKEASEILNIHKSNIYMAIHHNDGRKTTGGYKWYYIGGDVSE